MGSDCQVTKFQQLNPRAQINPTKKDTAIEILKFQTEQASERRTSMRNLGFKLKRTLNEGQKETFPYCRYIIWSI